MYKPLQVQQRPAVDFKTSTMPRQGMNIADTAQMMSLDYALNIVNYIPKRFGLEKRAGLDKIAERTGANAITLLKEFPHQVWVFGYAEKIEIYDANTDTYYTVKDDFSPNNGFDGQRYGDYFFVCNGVEKIGRISQTIAYDNLAGAFTLGEVITGGTSGAEAVVLQDAAGVITLGNIVGTFENDEEITGKDSGATADVNGVLTYVYTEVTASPVCGGLKVIGPRLYAYRLEDDESAVQYSEVDDGSNPPFDAWTQGTAADDGGSARYRNAGPVRAVAQNGPYTAVFSDNGFYSFYLEQLDSAGTIKKVEVIQNYTEDYGGARGAIETPMGIFYMNEAGLWQMVSVGQTDVPMSKQQMLTSVLLGANYFKDIDQTSSDLVHDVNQNVILITVAKDSTFNNLVIGYELDLKAFFTFQNWNINRFAKSNEVIYGASSVNTKIYNCFEGYSDDGLAIATEYYQEIPMNGLFNANTLTEIYGAGLLSPSTILNVRTDIYNLKGDFEADKTICQWGTNVTGGSGTFDEWGNAAIGDAAWGGAYEATETAGLIESFMGGSPRIQNFQRLRIKVTGGDKLRHIVTWLSAKITTKGPIKRRNCIKIT